MSIASEITRLRNAKNDIKTSIENKGVEVPSSAKLDDYFNYIDEISTGLEIKNGKIVNFKSYNENIEAGTFVNIYSVINPSTLNSLYNLPNYAYNKVSSLIKLTDTKIVIPAYLYNSTSSSNYYRIILLLVDTSNNKITRLNYYDYGSLYSWYSSNMSIIGAKIDDEHFIVFTFKPNQDMQFRLFEINSNTINLMYERNVNSLNGDIGSDNKGTPYDVGVSEDSSHYYIYTYYKGYIHGITINKTDYSYVSQNRLSYFGDYQNYPINLSINNFNNYMIVTSSNGKYSVFTYNGNFTSITTPSNISGISNCVFLKSIINNNLLYIFYCENDTSILKYKTASINSNGILTFSESKNLIINDSPFINSNYVSFNIIDNSTLLMFYKSYNSLSTKARLIKIINNELNVGSEIELASTSYNEEKTNLININSAKVNSNNEEDTIIIEYNNFIELFKIKGNLLESINGGLFVVKATDNISGLTNTECTPLVEGEVYLLDNSN